MKTEMNIMIWVLKTLNISKSIIIDISQFLHHIHIKKKTDIDPTYYDKYYVKRYHKQKENEFTCEFCGTQLKSGKHHQARHYKTKFCMNVKKLIADKLSLIEQKDCVLSPEEKNI